MDTTNPCDNCPAPAECRALSDAGIPILCDRPPETPCQLTPQPQR